MILPVIFASLMFTTSGTGENSPGTSLGSSVVIMWSCIPTGCPVAAASLLRDVSILGMLSCQFEKIPFLHVDCPPQPATMSFFDCIVTLQAVLSVQMTGHG